MKPHSTLLLISVFLFLFFSCEDPCNECTNYQVCQERIECQDCDYCEMCTHRLWRCIFGDISNKTIADIGTGLGHDAIFMADRLNAKKIIAIDIDSTLIGLLDEYSTEKNLNNLEARLTQSDDHGLKDNEADGVLIVNTYMYIDDRVNYLKRLRKGMKKGGKLVIVGYKKIAPRKLPPPEDRVPLYQAELDLVEANYSVLNKHDDYLEEQYIIVATK